MKKFLKITGIAIAVVALIISILLLYIGSSDIPSYDTPELAYTVVSTPESIARGEKLSTMLCATCHMDKETRTLIGKKMLDAPSEFGEIYSPNITHDKEHGIGGWTDAEIMYLLRTGIKKDGQYSPPYMAKLPLMADDDINAIISYLRSDNPMLAADNTPDQACKPSLLTKILSRVAFKPLPFPAERIEMPDTSNSVELGKYYAHNLDCFSCHSADFKTNDFLNPILSQGYFGGGNKPLDEQGRVMNTPNLTPDIETGIGSWTKSEFIKVIKFGQKEGEEAMRYPMNPYSMLTDEEAGAIYDYLQTIPAIHNKVERSMYN